MESSLFIETRGLKPPFSYAFQHTRIASNIVDYSLEQMISQPIHLMLVVIVCVCVCVMFTGGKACRYHLLNTVDKNFLQMVMN